MAGLRALAGELGHTDVATHLQSGNLVSTVGDGPEAERVAELEAAIEARFGFAVAVVVRTHDELAAVVAADPLAGQATDPRRHHVLFLTAPVAPERLLALEPDAHPPDVLVARGRELFLWTPGGIGSSKLARKLTDARLGTTATARNRRTVEALLAL